VRIRRKGSPEVVKLFERLTDAKAWARQVETDISRGKLLSNKRKRYLFSEGVEKYRDDILPLKPKSADSYDRHLSFWDEELGFKYCDEISKGDIQSARNKLKKKKNRDGEKLSPITVNRYMATLSHLFSVMVAEWEWLDINHVKGIKKLPEPSGRTRYLSKAEIPKLLAACKNSSSAMLYSVVLMALHTGMRKAEIFQLKWSDVELDQQCCYLRDTKNKDNRVVPLSSSVLDMLGGLDQSTTYVFQSPTTSNGDPKNRLYTEKPFAVARERAGIEDFRFHDLRHTAASYLAMSGAATTDVAEILGHKSLQMTQRYTHLNLEHKKSIVDKLEKEIFRG
jgi:integrase